MVFLNEIKYIPLRLKANVEGFEDVDEYVGVVLKGTPGNTKRGRMHVLRMEPLPTLDDSATGFLHRYHFQTENHNAKNHTSQSILLERGLFVIWYCRKGHIGASCTNYRP